MKNNNFEYNSTRYSTSSLNRMEVTELLNLENQIFNLIKSGKKEDKDTLNEEMDHCYVNYVLQNKMSANMVAFKMNNRFVIQENQEHNTIH
jgi:hypothetical protein